jgi:hypothetical protein
MTSIRAKGVAAKGLLVWFETGRPAVLHLEPMI